MRVIIYGAGAVGGVIGGHLTRIGQEVAFVGRGAQIQAIQENGLKFVTPAGSYVQKIPAYSSLSDVEFRDDDVVFLSVKGQDTEDALVKLKEVAPNVPVFCMQNGIQNEEIAAKYFSRVYGGMLKSICAVNSAPGEVIASNDPPARIVLGCYPQGTDELVEAVGAILAEASFVVKVTPDVMPYKWGKLIDVLGGVVYAITDVQGSETADLTGAVQQELRDLLAQAGMHYVSGGEVSKEMPAPVKGKLDIDAPDGNWVNLMRKTGKVEAGSLNGEVVRLAEKIGAKAPVNETLVKICLEMAANKELPGKYSPAQLREMLGMA